MMEMCLALLFLTFGGGLSQTAIAYDSTIHTKETCLCAQGNCDPGWVQYKNACYKKFDESVTWPEAEATCLSVDSHLASIHCREESDFVYVLMGSPNDPYSGRSYWIGVTDIVNEGSYVNIDGSKLTYLPFGEGQPDNLGEEDYIGFWYLENGVVTYNDYPLNIYKYPFVCKYYLGNRMCRRDETSYAG